jgi:hypothetical protein
MSERSDKARERTKRIWEERRARWDKWKREQAELRKDQPKPKPEWDLS